MRHYALSLTLLCTVACATTKTVPSDAERSSSDASASVLESLHQRVAPEPEPSSPPTTVESQAAQVSDLQTLERGVSESVPGLHWETKVVYNETGPRQVTGVPRAEAIQWVMQWENEVRRRIASEQWVGLEVTDFVRQQLDARVHESSMFADAGLVPPQVIQQYLQTFRDILQRAQSDEAFRVTFEVQTTPKGATFQLCREYVPTDCTTFGTNVTFKQVFRGKYIYKITMGGYHVVAAPLDLVHFGQSVLKCALRKETDGLGPVPCTPE